MKGWGSVEITVESLSAHRAVEKLERGGVPVLSAQNPRKNVVVLRVAARDRKKCFAILRGTCYNIKKTRNRGFAALRVLLIRSAGLAVGAALFAFCVFFAGSRVLKVEIRGSGAYYEREIRAILAEEGVVAFSPLPENTGVLTARILSLPRVEFCSFRKCAGVLTVTVECAQELSPLPSVPLFAPASGKIEELVVVRGTPCAAVGEEVQAGQEIVSNRTETGAQVVVIAKVTVSFAVSREYALGEREALMQAALDFGELGEVRTKQTESGWLVEGVAYATAACGLE